MASTPKTPSRKFPEYAPPTEQHEAIAQQSELPAVSAIPYKPVDPGDRHFWEYFEEGGRVLAREAQARKATAQAHVGTAAIGCPAQAKPSASVGTDALVRPGREATVPAAATGTTATVVPAAAIPPHDFKTPQPAPQQNPSPKSQSASPQRKPPETVKPTPQERKITAHAKSVAEKEETTSLEGAKTDFCQLPDSPYRTNTCDPHLSMPKSEPNHPVGGLAWIVRVLDG